MMSSIVVLRKPIFFFLPLIVACFTVHAQVQGGVPRYASTSGGPDIIDLSNLNVQLSIPIVDRTGRILPLTYGFTYDSAFYEPVTTPGPSGGTAWKPANSSMGWNATGAGSPSVYLTAPVYGFQYCGTVGPPPWNGFTFSDYRGVNHAFASALSLLPGQCSPVGYTAFQNAPALDGSGITLSVVLTGQGPNPAVTMYVTMPNGSQLTFPWVAAGTFSTKQIETISTGDNNGNYISNSDAAYIFENGPGYSNQVLFDGGSYTDTLGNTALLEGTPVLGPDGTVSTFGPVSYYYGPNTYPPNDQPMATVTPLYGGDSVETNFGCSGISEYAGGAPEGPYFYPSPLMGGITLADGRSYVFAYEAGAIQNNVTGRIAKIFLPGGGEIDYSYTTISGASVNCATGSPLGFTRTVHDGNGSVFISTYASANNVTTVKDMTTGFYSVHTFIPINGSLGMANSGHEYVETSIVSYDNLGNALNTVNKKYNGLAQGTAPGYPITSINTTTFVPNASTGVATAVNQVFSPLGMPTETDIYDYGSAGSGAAGPLLSKTTTTYWTTLGLVYDRPQTVTTYGPNGTTVTAQSMYTYDEKPVIATVDTPNHTAGYNVGNLTTFKQLVSGSNWLTSTYTYYDTGNVATSTDVNGAVTTYAYLCGNSLLGSASTITNGSPAVPLITSQTWNCGNPTIASTTDVNGNVSTASYNDVYDRTTLSTDPFGNATAFTYPSISSNTSTSQLVFNGGNSTNKTVTTYDGLSRPILQQNSQGPSSTNYDSVAISYNSFGQTSYTSMPYSAAAGSYVVSGPGTNTTYDGLGRTYLVTDGGLGTTQYNYKGKDVMITQGPKPAGENLKVRVLEYNGAGALTSVCEVTSTLVYNGPCGQQYGLTGYLTTYAMAPGTLSVQQDVQMGGEGVQARIVNYDMLGRTTSETIPESGTNGTPGTIIYRYDSDSSGNCPGTYYGDQVFQQDNAGNITCFTYDNQHRVLSTIVKSGPAAALTAQRHYVYDAATVNGTAMQNAKGALVEAYTCANPGTCATKLTDIGSNAYPEGAPGAYTGRMVQQTLESTPSSAGYFISQATSYPNGMQAALSVAKGGATVLPSLTYGVDGEGRPNSVTDATNSLNLVTGVAYSMGSFVSGVTYGNGDSDSYTPDPNTGRTLSFQNVVTSAIGFTDTGTTTWNQNGSLMKFVWTDGNNAAFSQTCNYSSDDINRIASVTCPSGWGQTFTYDPFGNVTKTANGGTSYSAKYYPATNHVMSGAIATYDLNGNQTAALLVPSLTYDANHNPITAGSTTMVYDALGRLAETSGKPVVYGPSGERLGVFNGSSYTASFALPGGGEAYYTSGALTGLRRKDWLGSSRLETNWAHVVISKVAYAPFAETYNQNGSMDADFTDQTQDSVASFFDFPARKYDSNAGRWTVPDPGAWDVVDPTNPQSFNRYAYVTNQPMNAVDPTGEYESFLVTCNTTITTVPGPYGDGTKNVANTVCSFITFWVQDPYQIPLFFPNPVNFFGNASSPQRTPAQKKKAASRSLRSVQQISAVNNCSAQAQSILDGQPSVTPNTQNLIDGAGAAVFTLLTDGASKVLSSFFKGAVVRSAIHAVQKGGMSLMTYHTCLTSAGVGAPYNPYTF